MLVQVHPDGSEVPFRAPVNISKVRVLMQGFKDFIMRGNLVEMAIAFIMGSVFPSALENSTSACSSPQ